ncbi:MAG: DUF6268 family outer membrane beta-barrel protein [Saprospiraceae bacterium]|nr:DUF6268 family outer membrane beta-barrel protein [Saprospiraceae bacterium]
MKISFFALLLLLSCTYSYAQDYVDLFRSQNNFAFQRNNVNSDGAFTNNHLVRVYLPVRSGDKMVYLAGFTVENTNLHLFDRRNNRENLFMARLNLGLKHNHSEKLTGTYLVLPKIASNLSQVTGRDLQIGGLGLLDYKISETVKLKFGLYVSTENHGSTITPLLGLWYRSKNEKFYINAVLPIRMDISYNITGGLSVGADLVTSVKSYDLSSTSVHSYVHENSIRAGAYVSYGFMDNSVILRARGGYDLTDYGLYDTADPVGGQLLLFELSGDNRNRLNPEFSGGPFFAVDLFYRFDLRDEKK